MRYTSKQLDEFIVDLSEEYRNEIESIIEEKNPKNRSETDKILADFRKIKGFIKVGKFTERYWIQRGWTMEESIIKKNENKRIQEPGGSPMQIEYWIKRINPKTKNNYTIEEAKYKIRSQRKINIEYWIERGLSEESAILKIKDFQKQNSAKRKKYLGVTWNQYEYWMTKENMSVDEAKAKVSDLQKTYDLKKLITKYGNLEGSKRYEEMCKKLSNSHSLKGYIERYGEIIGREKYEEVIIKKCSNSGVSKESLIFFKKIYRSIRDKINREEIYWGIQGSKEYFLYDNESSKIFFYDFTIPSLKIIIEYHGKRYHPNPGWEEEKWKKWDFMGMSADNKRKLDIYKNQVAEKLGFEVIEIFSDDIKINTAGSIIDLILKKVPRLV